MRVIFIYEALTDRQKDAIDREVAEGLKTMILSNGSFAYTDKQLVSTIYDLVLFNKVIKDLLGDNSPPYFSMKEIVVKSRVHKIAYDLEHNRPSLEVLKEYIELCKLLSVEPAIEVLFDSDFLEETMFAFAHHIENEKTEKTFDKIIDKNCINDYTISSNIKSFEKLVRSFYELNSESGVYVTAN